MNIRPFEIALIGLFVVAAIAGLAFISLYQAKPSDDELLYGARIEIWGVVDQSKMNDYLEMVSRENKALSVVSYKEIDVRKFEDTFVNAVAEGKSPDLLIIPHTLLVQLRTKLVAISPQTISPRTFRDSYVDGADVFMRNDGVYAIPFAADPLVMYWNRDIFASAGVAQAPKTWESLIAQTVPALTVKSAGGQIQQSAIAFGEYDNVRNAKAIMSALLLQTGNSIVEEYEESYGVTLGNKSSDGLASGEASLSFYTQFSSPLKETYSWNRSMQMDRDEFVGGRLALYFGLGSEWQNIEAQNPNLNYDVTRIPQGAGATVLRTYADFYGFAIPKASQNTQGAFALSSLLSSPEYVKVLASTLSLTPVHRQVYGEESNSPFAQILEQSVLIARGWLDPNPFESGNIFHEMVREVTSGNIRYQNIVSDAVVGLENLF